MEQQFFQRAYTYFNARDIDSLLQMMEPSVDWPNGWEGGYVKGHAAIRDYWTRQWKELNPEVTPVDISALEDGRIKVRVKQFVKDLQGTVVFDDFLNHIYTIDEGLISKMEIDHG